MKAPEQKNKYRGAGFAARAALLAVAAVGCLAMCCSFTHAWFITERGAEQNTVETATYAVTVLDGEGNVLTDGKYVCPLVPEDLHQFTLQAAGTAYTGHCVVGVTAPGQSEVGYVVELAPDQSGAVSLQAAEGSLLAFSFDWGEGENPVEPAHAFGREDTLLFHIENSRTPHLLYEVAYGASPAGIAAYYGVDVEALCTYNDLDAGSANLPIYPKQGESLTYAIPYVEKHPVGGPYVPKGDLVLSLESAGDAVTPANTCILVAGPNGYLEQFWYSNFVRGACTLRDLPAGEYQFTVGNAELENYTLEMTGGMTAAVNENAETEHVIVNTYTRHKGDLMFWLKVSDAKVAIPAEATLVLYGPDDTREIPYAQFVENSLLLTELPTGQYTAVLVKADVANYDLNKADVMLTINQGETAYGELTAEYKRQVGTMKLNMVASGHEVPVSAYVSIYGMDGTYIEVPYANFVNGTFVKENVFAGEYVAKLLAADVEGYDLNTPEFGFTIKKDEVTQSDVLAEYKRHQGNARIQVVAEGRAVPGTARVVLTGSDGTRHEIFYVSFVEDFYTAANIPVGAYTVELVDANVDGYDLALYTTNLIVEKGKTVENQIAVAYQRQVGDLAITVEVSGAALPAGALLTIVGPDGYSNSVACGSCTLNGLPTGGYAVSAVGVELDGYTVAVTGGTAAVTKTGAGVNVSIVYTVIESAPEESTDETSGTQTEPTE